MKSLSKIFAISSIFALSLTVNAETQKIDFFGGYFYSSIDSAVDNSYMTSGKLLFVADLSGAGFSDFSLVAGSSLEVDSYVNSGNEYYIFGETSIRSSGMMEGKASDSFYVDLSSSLAGKDFAIIILGDSTDSAVAKEGDSYGVFTPTLLENPNFSGGDEWVIPTTTKENITVYAYSKGLMQGDFIPNEYLVMDKVVSVVPEPATCAFLFGAAALAIAAYRRKR